MGCIYMYTNKINDMKYIGQTTRNIKIRHWQHLSQNDTYFDRAISKYGKENFELTILEDNIDDINVLNAKECYYIEKYDTFNNGYNMCRGGENHTRFNQEDRDKIVELIKTTKLSFLEIGNLMGYSVYTISDINIGNCLPKSNEHYPIRKNRISEYFTYNNIEQVINLLLTTSYSFKKIAELTNTNFNFVADINRGKRNILNNKDIKFPIRETVKHSILTKPIVEKTIYLLKQDDLSAEEISNMVGIHSYTVGQINRGKHSICKTLDEDFPIRKKQHKCKNNMNGRKISDKQLFEIIELLLNTTLSTEEIAQRYNVDRTAINRINRGIVFKNITNKYKLPIRQNKDYNIKISNVNE